MIVNSILLGQEKKIKVEIVDCISTKKNISFCLRITNMSNKPIVTYLPKIDDICYGLIKIPIVELQNKKLYKFFPCASYAADLDCIQTNSKNSISLNPKEKYNQYLNLNKKNIFPRLKKGRRYKFFVEWYLEGVCFKTDFKNLIQENIKSDEITLNI